MTRYRKWVVTLGILSMMPSMTMAANPLSFFNKFRKPAVAQRSNQQVAEDIAKALRAAQLTAFDIEIEYKSGQATLLGKIANAQQKAKASQVVQQIAGVQGVNNRLEILKRNPPAATPFSAPQPTSVAPTQNVARTAPPANPSSLLPQKQQSPITTAAVTSDNASPINQIEQVSNRTTGASSQQIAQAVATALQQANLTGYDIEIRVKKGTVTLGGAVMTPQERAMVSQVASRVPGVQAVNNQLALQMQQLQQQFAPQQAPIMPASFQAPGAPAAPGQPGIPAPPSYGHPGRGASHTVYNMPNLPEYSWPSYASYPNYAQLSYPKQYSASAWPYIGPFYPYPQIPLGWRQVQLEWDDGAWNLNFRPRTDRWFWFLKPENW